MTQPESPSIPTLTDVLVPGKPVPARSSAADAPARAAAAIPVLTDVVVPGRAAAVSDASEHAGTDPEFVVVEPVPTPDVPAVELPGDSDAPAQPGAAGHVVAEESAAALAPLASALAAEDPQRHSVAAAPVDDDAIPRQETAQAADALATDHLAGGVSQPAAPLTPEDAQHIAERLRNRLTTYLTGEGREAIEARCRDALHDHTAWLVGQITREVALALETEVMEWVRDAVDEEIARRRTGHSG